MSKTSFPVLLLALVGCPDASETQVSVADPESVEEVLTDLEEDHYSVESCVWDASTAIEVFLEDSTATSVDAGMLVDDDSITLTHGGTWIVRGTLLGRQLVVDTDDDVQLVLDGVELESSVGPALRVENADSIAILLADGSLNSLRDGTTHPDTQEAPNAALSSRSDLTICGSGSLTVEGRYRDGVASSDGLVVADGLLGIQAVDDGLRGKDYLTVRGGTLDLVAGGDGLVSDNEEDAGNGYVLIEAGQVSVMSDGDAVSAATELLVTGGTVDLVSGGGAGTSVGEDSAKGLKAGTGVYIAGGDLVVDAADDAIHSDGVVVFSGGAATLSTGDDGIHANTSLDVTGGELDIVDSYEGLESLIVSISGGVTHIVASDDGISVSDGTGIGGLEPGAGTQPGSEAICDTCFLFIEGGRLVVDAAGDGLDSNGFGVMSGGVVIVNGPPGDDGPPDAALDFGELDITGGLLVAVHKNEMPNEIDGESTQRYVDLGLGSSQSAGTLVHLEQADGTGLLTFAPAKAFAALTFSSPDLETGTHRLYVGGSAEGTELDGLYEDETYSAGTLELEFSVSGIATSAGQTSQSGPGGSGRPPF